MQVFHYSCYAMATRFNMVLPKVTKATGNAIAIAIQRILVEEEACLSCYMDRSEVSIINRLARNRPTKVSENLASVFDSCHSFYNSTGGAFDIGLKRLNSLVKRYKGKAHIMKVVDGIGWQNIDWDPSEKQIWIRNNRAAIDLGGFGKGWALEKVRAHLMRLRIKSAFISFGESTIATIGTHPLGDSWQVAVAHPVTGVSTLVALKDEAISVSGLRVLGVNGEANYLPHIYKPESKSIVNDNRVVLVKSQSPLTAEVLSTAVMAASESQLEAILHNYPQETILECQTGASAFQQFKSEPSNKN